MVNETREGAHLARIDVCVFVQLDDIGDIMALFLELCEFGGCVYFTGIFEYCCVCFDLTDCV